MTSLRKTYSSLPLFIAIAISICLLPALLAKINFHQSTEQPATTQAKPDYQNKATKGFRQPVEPSLKDAVRAVEYTIKPVSSSLLKKEYEAINRANSFSTTFSEDGINLLPTKKAL